MIKGVNIGGWFSQHKYDVDHFENFITQKDYDILKENGTTHIRLPFDGYAILDDNYNINKEGYDYLIKKSNEILDNGFKLILDFHIPPWFHFLDFFNNKEITFFNDEKLIKKHSEVLKEVIKPFHGNKNVYLELLNEPVAPDAKTLNNFYRNMITQLRELGVVNTLVIESNKWGSIEGFEELEYFDNLGDIVYSFHFYRPERFTHQRAPWINLPAQETVDYPYIEENGEKIDKNYMIDKLKYVLNFREKYNANIFCGEFGVYLRAPRESRYRWLKDFLDILEEHKIGHTYWSYKGMDFGIVETKQEYLDFPEYDDDKMDKELLKLLSKYWKGE